MHPRFYSLPGYDDESSPYDDLPRAGLTDRLTHLVLVDGRLVDVWSEPVEHTRWAHHAAAPDHRWLAPQTPEAPLPERVLAWLRAVCGGQEALEVLDGEPLAGDPGLPTPDDSGARAHLTEAAALLDEVAATFFDAETGVALRRALVRFWAADPRVRLRSPAHLAAGVCWTVGKANLLLGPGGRCMQGTLSQWLGLGASGLSAPGQTVRRSLTDPMLHAPRPWQAPEIDLLGHPDLLLGTTRARLVRLRDQARSLSPDRLLP